MSGSYPPSSSSSSSSSSCSQEVYDSSLSGQSLCSSEITSSSGSSSCSLFCGACVCGCLPQASLFDLPMLQVSATHRTTSKTKNRGKIQRKVIKASVGTFGVEEGNIPIREFQCWGSESYCERAEEAY